MSHPLLQAMAIAGLSLMAAAFTAWMVGEPMVESVPCDPATLKPGEICLSDVPGDRPVLWIDARSRAEWERNGQPGSILWNLDGAEDRNAMEEEAVLRIFETPYVIVYCSDKGCGTSHKIATHITDTLQLDAEVHVLHDGWRALRAAGLVGSQ